MKKADVYLHFGGCRATARALSITSASVAAWGDVIPKGRAYEIQALTEGALTVDLSLY